jgi:hypothetical protein
MVEPNWEISLPIRPQAVVGDNYQVWNLINPPAPTCVLLFFLKLEPVLIDVRPQPWDLNLIC